MSSLRPPRSSRPSSVSFPPDYSICPTCNMDHRHDVPRLNEDEKAAVLRRHALEEAVVPYDLLIALRPA